MLFLIYLYKGNTIACCDKCIYSFIVKRLGKHNCSFDLFITIIMQFLSVLREELDLLSNLFDFCVDEW